MFLTVLTPTYNRADLLKRLYESLVKQTNQDFLWLVVDDGSSDNTGSLISNFKNEGKIAIEYICQENGGKHRALNKGIKRVQTELTFIVDSDDFLPEKAVEIIAFYHHKYKQQQNICGYCFLRAFEDGRINTGAFPKDEMIESYIESRINANLGGDKAEVFFTDILKQFRFPEFEEEKFLPEDTVWVAMATKYQMVHINKIIYLGEYLEGGLTKRGRNFKVKSPKGMMERSETYLHCSEIHKKFQLKMTVLLIVYGKIAGFNFNQLLRKTDLKGMFYVLYLPSCVIYEIWKIKYKI